MLIKTLSGALKVAFDSDYESLKKIPLNEAILFKWTKQRNVKFHRKFFALIKMVYENQEQYKSIDKMRKDLTIAAGYYNEETNYLNGLITQDAKSISFDKMDQNEFNEFYSRFIDAVIAWLKWDKQDILDNIEQHF